MPTQPPTCTNLRIRSVHDAEIVLHAVTLGVLPMVHRRLDDDDRLSLTTGCIYVWEERSSNPLECTGQEIQRFTEGRSWGPSRARDVSVYRASLRTCIHGYLTSLFVSVVGLLVVLRKGEQQPLFGAPPEQPPGVRHLAFPLLSAQTEWRV